MRTFILIAALACAAPAAFAADDKPAGSSVIVPATPSTQAAGTAGTPAPGAPAAAPAAPASAAPAAEAPKSATLVGGDTADVIRIHVVEKRPFTEAGRGELSIFGPVQINSKFTTHIGAALEFAYHLRENIAVQAGVLYNPYAVQSSLTEELVTKVHQQPLAANALLLKAGAMAGLELMPVYGKINIFDGKILRIGFYLNAGLGGASTRLQIRGSNDVEGRSFGDTGVRLMAALGAGFRVFLGERFTLRLEVRDQMYSAYVSKVNGCTYTDTRAIYTSGTTAHVSDGCDASAFGDKDSDVKSNAAVASDQMKEPSADVINNLAAYTGLSFLF